MGDSSSAWRYIPNAAGGFQGFWWNFLRVPDRDLGVYLQLHGRGELFVRIHSPGWDTKVTTTDRDHVLALLRPTFQAAGFELDRTRFRGSASGAIARIVPPAGRWIEYEHGVLDEAATLDRLRLVANTLQNTVTAAV